MKKCPRCLQNWMHDENARNALSRRYNKTYICPPCGISEALIDSGAIETDDFEKAFVEKVKG